MSHNYSDLNESRIEAILAHRDELKAAKPTGEGVDPQIYRDFGTLWELWGHVQSVPPEPTENWVRAARAEVDASIEMWRNWKVFDPARALSEVVAKMAHGPPIPGATPEVMEAARAQLLERLGTMLGGQSPIPTVHPALPPLQAISDEHLRTIAPYMPRLNDFFAFMSTREGPDPEEVRDEDPEARAWLKQRRGDAMLAANWFGDTAAALSFVEKLYAAGAEKIVIASESIKEEEDDDLYADAMRVVMPKAKKKRAAVFAVLKEEEDPVYPLEEDTGQPVVFLWWD